MAKRSLPWTMSLKNATTSPRSQAWTRSARLSGVSPGRTSTRRWATMGPVSYPPSTRCTVAPDSTSPAASRALWTWIPYIPWPPCLGNKAGWVLKTRPAYRPKVSGPNLFMYPAKRITSAATASIAARIARSRASGSACVLPDKCACATPAARARRMAPESALLERTIADSDVQRSARARVEDGLQRGPFVRGQNRDVHG
jgi:hypothetical protein